jgi:poly(glycerol-phosphate) alpha-glucosyltransferase
VNTAHLSYSISRAFGGIFEICRRTAQTLAAEQGMKVNVFGVEDEFTTADLAAWRPLEPRAFRACGPKSYGFTPRLAAALDAVSPDVVHVHGLWTFSTLAARRWAERRRRPYLVTIHGMLEPWALRQSRWKKAVAAALFERSSLRQATCLHVNTDEERRHLRAYGLRNPVCVIPNGVDLPCGLERAAPPWSGQIPESAKVLLYLGRLHPKKGLPNLLRAWAAARRDAKSPVDRLRAGPAHDWHLALVGWDQAGHLAQLQAQVDHEQLQETVHFLGPQFGPARAAAYQNAHALVLPSFSEGLPMGVLEGWANSLPVLMTSHCHLPEGFTARAAWPIEPDVESITRGLHTLFQMEPEELRQTGKRGRELVAARFSWSQAAAALHEVYRWMLQQGPPPACLVTA